MCGFANSKPIFCDLDLKIVLGVLFCSCNLNLKIVLGVLGRGQFHFNQFIFSCPKTYPRTFVFEMTISVHYIAVATLFAVCVRCDDTPAQTRRTSCVHSLVPFHRCAHQESIINHTRMCRRVVA